MLERDAEKGMVLNHKVVYQAALIGTVSIQDVTHREGTIGYWIDEKFQRQGITTFAVKSIMSKLSSLGLVSKFYLRYAPDNVASWKVARKCGFLQIETLKDGQNLYGRKTVLIVCVKE